MVHPDIELASAGAVSGAPAQELLPAAPELQQLQVTAGAPLWRAPTEGLEPPTVQGPGMGGVQHIILYALQSGLTAPCLGRLTLMGPT